MMTREQHLYSMKGCDLIKEADKLGIKVNCNKTRTQLSESKQKVVERILAAEVAAAQPEEIHIEEIEEEIEMVETQTEEIVEETQEEEIEEEIIPPFVYAIYGETWEDADIGEMIYKWSDEKKTAFRIYFDNEFLPSGGFDTQSEDDLKAWSAAYDVEHGIKKEKKEKQEVYAPAPKRGALIEWNGKSQNICKWGEELGISPNTLYGRIYKMNWTVEKAFTTRPRK